MSHDIKPLPAGFFRANQQKLISRAQFPQNSFILLSGPVTTPHYDDDALSYVFLEKLYYYLTGITSDPNTYAFIDTWKRTVTVFCKEYDPATNYWQKLKTPEDFMREFEIDKALYLKDLPDVIRASLYQGGRLYLYRGFNPYSSIEVLNPLVTLAEILGPFEQYINRNSLYEMTTEARVTKTPLEINAIQEAANTGMYVHKQLMRQLRPKMTERDLSNLFTSIRVSLGASLAYPNIVAGAENASFLHYEITHNRELREGDLVLIDAGCQVHGYNSDITRTLPVSGKFSPKQAEIYGAVLLAQREALAMIRPGMPWLQVHLKAEKSLYESLVRLGLLSGTVEELCNTRVIYHFMPHGIGHYIGLYIHDLKGRSDLENKYPPHPKMNIRVTRALEEGMVLTVEPGLYFNQALLEAGYNDDQISRFFNREAIEAYRKEVGGVRIEDMIVVTEGNYRLLTEGLPRSIAEVEAFMKG